MIYGNYKEVPQSKGRTARRFVGFPKSRRRNSLRPGFSSNKEALSSETSTTPAIFEGDRYRGALLLLPIVVALVSLYRASIRYQSSAFRRCSPTPGRSLEVVRHVQTRDRAEMCGERTELTQPRRARFGVEESCSILNYRGGNLKRTGEFTFARYAPPFSAESSDSSRSRATLAIYPICSR